MASLWGPRKNYCRRADLGKPEDIDLCLDFLLGVKYRNKLEKGRVDEAMEQMKEVAETSSN